MPSTAAQSDTSRIRRLAPSTDTLYLVQKASRFSISGWRRLLPLWHNSDIPPWSLYVRCWTQSGKHMLALSFSAFDPDCVKTPSML